MTDAVFATTPQSAASVVATTCTKVLEPAGRVVGAKTSAPPWIDQPSDSGEIDQSKPTGSGSENAMPRASPVPVFPSVTVKPICVAGGDLVVVGHLLHVELGALDVRRVGGGVLARVRGAHGRGVVQLPAVRVVGGGDHVDGGHPPGASVAGL